MNADTNVNLFGWLFVEIVSLELRLDLLSGLNSMHHRRKVHQEGIPDNLDDRAVMFCDGFVDNLVVRVQQSQRTGFIGAHLTAEAHDVGEHDGG
jgi:hypothetical protein